MRRRLRTYLDRAFTGSSLLSILMMSAALVIILAPMMYRGSKAVLFRGTVEFRKMQLNEPMFHRGNSQAIAEETERTEAARKPVYDLLERFGALLDTELSQKRARRLYRELKKQLRNRVENGEISQDRCDELQGRAKQLRNALVDAYEAGDNETAQRKLAVVLEPGNSALLAGTVGEQLVGEAGSYAEILQTMDLSQRGLYRREYLAVKDIVGKLLGPPPEQRGQAHLTEFRYGATRWDRARQLLDELLWKTTWAAQENGGALSEGRTKRADLFRQTQLARLFDIIERDAEKMLAPKRTFYWQYFIDDCTPGHLFGGVGPEILGTVLLTALAIGFSVPLGIVSAAYLIECKRDSCFVRAVRVCINTLAGVPSIVFGLFGLAFFLDWLPARAPWLGFRPGSNILAGALTLAILVLPIIIRASEEAIRSVPRTYKEAALATGAGGLRTFLTVTLPAALPGILTGIVLSLGRAAGETAPILFTAAVAWRMGMPRSLLEGGTRALSYSSYDVAVGDRVAMDAPHNQYGMVMTLVLLVLLLNMFAIVIRSRVARKLRGQ